MYYVYAIYNKLKNKIYIGQTKDIAKRLKRHNGAISNKKTSYTHKQKGYWKLVYQESANTRSEAIKREKQLKSFKGREFIRSQIKGP